MSSVWGNNIKLSIFGESHGAAIGINIDGLPAGFELDMEAVEQEMGRRAPGSSVLATTRKEADSVQILSGFFNGKTTGTPLCAVIYNENQHSKDYEKTRNLMRPSHADYTGCMKYGGFNDYRGGGHFSGRLTAPLVFAGAVCTQILKKHDIFIGSHIKSILDIEDNAMNENEISRDELDTLRQSDFPVLNHHAGSEMKEAIMRVREENDSVGGIIETAVINLAPGVGEPFFDSAESTLAHLLFSIPGVKAVEFGAGFGITRMKGSEANDAFYMKGNEIKTKSNNNGGILGGITNGMPLIFRVAVKPAPSIGKVQDTIDIEKRENSQIEIKGRHDPCIVPRAVPVVEAVTAIAVLELLLEEKVCL